MRCKVGKVAPKEDFVRINMSFLHTEPHKIKGDDEHNMKPWVKLTFGADKS